MVCSLVGVSPLKEGWVWGAVPITWTEKSEKLEIVICYSPNLISWASWLLVQLVCWCLFMFMIHHWVHIWFHIHLSFIHHFVSHPPSSSSTWVLFWFGLLLVWPGNESSHDDSSPSHLGHCFGFSWVWLRECLDCVCAMVSTHWFIWIWFIVLAWPMCNEPFMMGNELSHGIYSVQATPLTQIYQIQSRYKAQGIGLGLGKLSYVKHWYRNLVIKPWTCLHLVSTQSWCGRSWKMMLQTLRT